MPPGKAVHNGSRPSAGAGAGYLAAHGRLPAHDMHALVQPVVQLRASPNTLCNNAAPPQLALRDGAYCNPVVHLFVQLPVDLSCSHCCSLPCDA